MDIAELNGEAGRAQRGAFCSGPCSLSAFRNGSQAGTPTWNCDYRALSFPSELFSKARMGFVYPSSPESIRGFGGGMAYYQNWLNAHPQKQAIYDTVFTGLGLSYLRIGNWSQDTTAQLADDSTIVAEAKKRLGARLRVIMSSWSAPGFLKVSGQTQDAKNDHQGRCRAIGYRACGPSPKPRAMPVVVDSRIGGSNPFRSMLPKACGPTIYPSRMIRI